MRLSDSVENRRLIGNLLGDYRTPGHENVLRNSRDNDALLLQGPESSTQTRASDEVKYKVFVLVVQSYPFHV